MATRTRNGSGARVGHLARTTNQDGVSTMGTKRNQLARNVQTELERVEGDVQFALLQEYPPSREEVETYLAELREVFAEILYPEPKPSAVAPVVTFGDVSEEATTDEWVWADSPSYGSAERYPW